MASGASTPKTKRRKSMLIHHKNSVCTYIAKHCTPATWSALLRTVDAELIPEGVW